MNQVISMTPVDIIPLLAALFAGGALGAVFFAGLWWTVLQGTKSKRPAVWFLGSFLVRMSIVFVGIYFVAGDSLPRLLACLPGFILARFIVTKLTRASTTNQDVTSLPSLSNEVSDHAP